MPRTTHQYPFELHIQIGVASRLKALLELTPEVSSYLLVLNSDHSLTLHAGTADVSTREHLDRIRGSGTSYVYYAPLDDGMEYRWLEWQQIDQVVMQNLIGRSLEADDFKSLRSSEAIDYPESWSVMF